MLSFKKVKDFSKGFFAHFKIPCTDPAASSADNATGTTEDHVLMQIPSHFGTMSAVDADNGRLNGPRHAGLSNPAFIPASLPTTDDTNTIPASPSTLQQVASSPEEHVAGPILKVIDNDIYVEQQPYRR